MILIADGGSTRTGWCLADDGGVRERFETEGYHPFFVDNDYIGVSLQKNIPESVAAVSDRVSQIFFYSTGGGYSSETDQRLIDGMAKVFSKASILIETDLLAAARALLQRTEGFAAILGTGTNSCLYDGEKITANIESLGFLLGDEGSGSYIGKKIIGDYIRGCMPETVKRDFFETFRLTPMDLLNKVYESSTPNRYCASFAKFVGVHRSENSYYEQTVYDAFWDFFRNIVSMYPHYRSYAFHCVGSIAYHFQDILERVVAENGMKMGLVHKDAMQGLIDYHRVKL